MATYRDVEMLNSSIDRLGDSLLRNRMLDEQKREREATRTDRQRERSEDRALRTTERSEDRAQRDKQYGLEERRVTASEKSAAASDDMRKLLLEDRKTQEAIAQVRNQLNDVSARHRAGQISTAQANAQIARIKTGIEQGTSLILKESGLADFTLQDVPQKEAGEFNTAATRNLQERLKLEQALATAKTPEEKIAAELALKLWKEERGSGDSERVTEYDRDPETGDLVRSRSRTERGPGTTGPRTTGTQTQPAGPGKQLTLDQAKQFLAQANGDKDKARELARKAGFKF